MNSKEYIKLAKRSESTNFNMTTYDQRMLHGAMGLCTESGEFLDNLKKSIYYRKGTEHWALVEELGDILWYLAILFDELGVSFESVMEMNIKKLKQRYPEKFTSEASENRDYDAENLAAHS